MCTYFVTEGICHWTPSHTQEEREDKAYAIDSDTEIELKMYVTNASLTQSISALGWSLPQNLVEDGWVGICKKTAYEEDLKLHVAYVAISPR
jgi:hypothetical protein